MKRFIIVTALTLLAGQALAGGRLDDFKTTGREGVPGFQELELVGMFWDQRCADISYVVDNVAANAGTPDEISPAVIQRELQTSFDQWNRIPTSYINMNIVGVKTLNNGLPTLDFVNELTFEAQPGAPFLAFTSLTSLSSDAVFVAGDDLDGDGDSDVFDPKLAKRNSCVDLDRDGDIEFPAGNYKAGTIIDADVLFNPEVAWSTAPGDDLLADIQAVAVHEFGHAHGLSHSVINQISNKDGSGATMFPFIDISDAASETAQRSLHSDDIAWSSFIYQEGTAASGPAALQRGDRPFRADYGLIKGEITQRGRGVAGAAVAAVSKQGETLFEAFSGTSIAYLNLATGQAVVLDTPDAIRNGNYTIPVQRGIYDLAIEALDGSPVDFFRISNNSFIGGVLGQHTFPAEFRSLGVLEDERELLPALSVPVIAVNGVARNGIDLVTNEEITLRNSGPPSTFFIDVTGIPDVIYAERFANATVLAQLGAGARITSAQFNTIAFEASTIARFKRAGLYFGRVNADGNVSVDLTQPVFARSDFVTEDNDTTPIFAPLDATARVKSQLQADPTLDVFLVLEADNNAATGTAGIVPYLRFEADPVPPTGQSYFSSGGQPLRPTLLNWAIELHMAVPKDGVAQQR